MADDRQPGFDKLDESNWPVWKHALCGARRRRQWKQKPTSGRIANGPRADIHLEAAALAACQVPRIDGPAGGESAVSVDVVTVPVRMSGQHVRCFVGGEQERTVAGRVEAANSSGNARTFGGGAFLFDYVSRPLFWFV